MYYEKRWKFWNPDWKNQTAFTRKSKSNDFFIKNFDLVKKMCENSEMTDEEIQKRLAIAKENHDHIMLALLIAVQVFNEK